MFISIVHSCLLNFKPGTKGWGARFPQHPSGLPVRRCGWIAAHPPHPLPWTLQPRGWAVLPPPPAISCIIQNSLLSCTFDFLADTPSSFLSLPPPSFPQGPAQPGQICSELSQMSLSLIVPSHVCIINFVFHSAQEQSCPVLFISFSFSVTTWMKFRSTFLK